ncbi:MAG: hypothetical protein R3A52_12325 [Polyangiales bacterium]
MATDNERDDGDDEVEEQAESEEAVDEAARPDPNQPRNRAERRAAAKAARRGRQAVLSDGTQPQDDEGLIDPETGLIAPTTSMGGSPGAIPGVPSIGPRKPPPRTMSRGTGTTDGVPEWARSLGEKLAANRNLLVGAALGVIVSIGAAVGYTEWRERVEARAASDFAGALSVASAPISESGESSGSSGPSFRTLAERQRASLERFRKVIRDHGSSHVAPLAKLAEAGVLYQLGRYEEAKAAYQSLLGRDLAGLDGRVLEGLAFSLEATGDLNGAMARYRELESSHGGAYQDQARFYEARLLLRQDQRDRAKDLLHGVAERTARPSSADPLAPIQSNLRQQAVALLRDIDPRDPVVVEADRARSAAGGQGGEHGPQGTSPGRTLPPELLQQLLQRARQQQGAAGTPPSTAPTPTPAPTPAQ